MKKTPLEYRANQEEIRLRSPEGIDYISKLSQSMKTQKNCKNKQSSIFNPSKESKAVIKSPVKETNKRDSKSKEKSKEISSLFLPLNFPDKFPTSLSHLNSFLSPIHLSHLATLSITSRSLHSLLPPHWLSDEIINAFITSLCQICPPNFLLLNSYIPQLSPLSLQSALLQRITPLTTHILFPLHCKAHWALLLLHLPSRRMTLFDSYFLNYSSKTIKEARRLKKAIGDALGEQEWELGVQRVSQQKNGDDWGVYLWYFAYGLVRGKGLNGVRRAGEKRKGVLRGIFGDWKGVEEGFRSKVGYRWNGEVMKWWF